MTPLSALDSARLRGVTTVLFDIDDTLTTHGQLTAPAYAAMARAKEAGLTMVPITGRPAGWCDHIARMWPVDGVVGENGAFYFWHDAATRRLVRRFVKDAPARRDDRRRLESIMASILSAVPGCAPASDQPYREADIAIDFCEDVPPLPRAEVERIRDLMTGTGLTAKISSIHVNGWFGGYDKLSTTTLFFRERLGRDLDAALAETLFIGDSPNDAPMFEFFPLSIGVANVIDFADRLPHPPRFVTRQSHGAGFAEVIDALLAAR